MKTIIHAVHIHASPTQVYDALTTAEGLSKWWTTQVAVEPYMGGVIGFTFHGDFHPQMQQTVLEPHRLVRWTCVGGHPNWQDNTFVFTLEDRKGETRVGGSCRSTPRSSRTRSTGRTTSTGGTTSTA